MTDEEILNKNKEDRQQCECWTRVMGYYRPVSGYNKGKQSEFNERVWFTEEKANAYKERNTRTERAVC